jgi:hypothetical protein
MDEKLKNLSVLYRKFKKWHYTHGISDMGLNDPLLCSLILEIITIDPNIIQNYHEFDNTLSRATIDLFCKKFINNYLEQL